MSCNNSTCKFLGRWHLRTPNVQEKYFSCICINFMISVFSTNVKKTNARLEVHNVVVDTLHIESDWLWIYFVYKFCLLHFLNVFYTPHEDFNIICLSLRLPISIYHHFHTMYLASRHFLKYFASKAKSFCINFSVLWIMLFSVCYQSYNIRINRYI